MDMTKILSGPSSTSLLEFERSEVFVLNSGKSTVLP